MMKTALTWVLEFLVYLVVLALGTLAVQALFLDSGPTDLAELTSLGFFLSLGAFISSAAICAAECIFRRDT